MYSYQVQMEISGNTAMWTRPDTGDCPVTYPVPTYSAVKGIFESILWGPAVKIVPEMVEICAPLQYHTYHTNYGGPLREVGVITSGGSYQLLATVLIDVCYRLYAKIFPIDGNKKELITQKSLSWDKKTTSPGHAYQDIFNRRLSKGQCFSIPFLGWKEFGPNYFGSFRANTKVQTDFEVVIPSMLREVFSDGYNSKVAYSFDQNISISNGTLLFTAKETNHAE